TFNAPVTTFQEFANLDIVADSSRCVSPLINGRSHVIRCRKTQAYQFKEGVAAQCTSQHLVISSIQRFLNCEPLDYLMGDLATDAAPLSSAHGATVSANAFRNC